MESKLLLETMASFEPIWGEESTVLQPTLAPGVGTMDALAPAVYLGDDALSWELLMAVLKDFMESKKAQAEDGE